MFPERLLDDVLMAPRCVAARKLQCYRQRMKLLVVAGLVMSLLGLSVSARAQDDESYEDRRKEAAAEAEREEAAIDRDNRMACLSGINSSSDYCRARGMSPDRGSADEDSYEQGDNTVVWLIVGAVAATMVARLIEFEYGEDAKAEKARRAQKVEKSAKGAKSEETRPGLAAAAPSSAQPERAPTRPDPALVKKVVYGLLTALVAFGAFSLLGLATAWRIFAKAGRRGWHALVPIYNWWTMLELSGLPGWLSLVPVVNFFALAVLVPLSIARRFGRSDAFAIGLLVAGWLFFPVLAFGRSRYAFPSRLV